MSTTEQNKAQFRRTYEEVLNRGGPLRRGRADRSRVHQPQGPARKRPRPRESMRGLANMLRTAFPDLHFEIHELVAEGEIVAGRLTMSGTHEGPLTGTPPTGRRMRQAHMHFVRFRDGLAVEQWGVRDDLGMMQQLGVLPELRQAGEASPT